MPELFGLNACQDGETGPGKCEHKRKLCTTPRKKGKSRSLKKAWLTACAQHCTGQKATLK